jgi:hypothetical protein
VLHLLVTANDIPSSLIHFTLMKVSKRSSETQVLKKSTRRNNTEEDILHHIIYIPNNSQKKAVQFNLNWCSPFKSE